MNRLDGIGERTYVYIRGELYKIHNVNTATVVVVMVVVAPEKEDGFQFCSSPVFNDT